MKKTHKTKRFVEAAVTITIALAFLLPGPTVLANGETQGGVMQVADTTAHAGDTGHIVPISGSWNESLGGYEIAMRFDAAMITIADVSLEGTVAEPLNFNLYWSVSEDNESFVVAMAITFHNDPVPPGSGDLFKLILDISESASGETLLDLDQDVGPMHNGCGFANIFGDYFEAETIDGTLTILPAVLCGDVTFDGIVNIGDVVYMINRLFIDPSVPIGCEGDVNGDGMVNVGDIVFLVSYLYRGGPAPVDDCCA
jgi:hypothetical protein